MTQEEFLLEMKKNGATFAPASSGQSINLANTKLQQNQSAMLPEFMINLYQKTGGINLGNGYIFGPSESSVDGKFPVPDLLKVNKDFNKNMRGKTIFGRNDLFFFAFDCFGTCFMLNNLTLNPLKKYDDCYRALTDCLIAGKN